MIEAYSTTETKETKDESEDVEFTMADFDYSSTINSSVMMPGDIDTEYLDELSRSIDVRLHYAEGVSDEKKQVTLRSLVQTVGC